MTYLKSVVCPATKLENARLFIKWKVFDVDLARALVNCRRFPFDQPLIVDGSLGGKSHFEVSVRAEIGIDKDQQPFSAYILIKNLK